MKTCAFCESAATLSICVIISTLGSKPRGQENTKSLPCCKACLTRSEVWNGLTASTGLKQRVNTAADALTKRSVHESQLISEVTNVNSSNTGARESAPSFLSLPNGE